MSSAPKHEVEKPSADSYAAQDKYRAAVMAEVGKLEETLKLAGRMPSGVAESLEALKNAASGV